MLTLSSFTIKIYYKTVLCVNKYVVSKKAYNTMEQIFDFHGHSHERLRNIVYRCKLCKYSGNHIIYIWMY